MIWVTMRTPIDDNSVWEVTNLSTLQRISIKYWKTSVSVTKCASQKRKGGTFHQKCNILFDTNDCSTRMIDDNQPFFKGFREIVHRFPSIR